MADAESVSEGRGLIRKSRDEYAVSAILPTDSLKLCFGRFGKLTTRRLLCGTAYPAKSVITEVLSLSQNHMVEVED